MEQNFVKEDGGRVWMEEEEICVLVHEDYRRVESMRY